MPIYTFTSVISIDAPDDELAQRVPDEMVTKGLFGLRFINLEQIRIQRSSVVEGDRVVQDITGDSIRIRK